MAGHVSVEQRDDVAIVRIDKPPANAMDLELLEEGRAVLDELRAAEPGAVVLTGRERFFSAGMDLKVAPTLDEQGQRAMVAGINRLFGGWYSFPRPLVCAVNGHAIAGGFILALCGDRRVVGPEGRFGLTELRAGMPYPAVAITVVKAELGPLVARELVLGSDLVGSERACELGAFDELVEQDAVLERAFEIAVERSTLPTSTYAHVKQQLHSETLATIDEILRGGRDPLLGGWLSDESQAAAARVLRG